MVDYKQFIIVHFIHNILKGNMLAAGQVDSDTFHSYRTPTPTSSFFFFNGFDTVSLTLREENSLRVFENRMLRKTFALPDRRGDTGVEKNYITWNFTICTPHQIPFR